MAAKGNINVQSRLKRSLCISASGVLEVRACPHGRGVFAAKSFKPGDTIQSISGMIITTTPKSLPWKRWALIIGKTPEGEHLFWDEEDEGSDAYWSNFLDHDERPNVRFVIDTEKKVARLVAVCPIRTGEELFLNYREYDSDNWTPDRV